MLSEPIHVGAKAAAKTTQDFIYWNAPTREEDTEAQIAMVDRIMDRDYQGLILFPSQALALITPVRRVLSRGIPVVIIGSPLTLPASSNLAYILNDEEYGGRLAAQRVAVLLKGHGTVAVLGINPDIAGIMTRARVFEQFLSANYPDIHIVEKRMGSFSVPHERQAAEEVLNENPTLDAVVALMWSTAEGTLAALDAIPGSRSVKVVGFDAAWSIPFDSRKNLDSVIQENGRAMGQLAVEWIHARQMGQSAPNLVYLHPTLITRENIGTPEVRWILSEDWKLGSWSAPQ